MFSNIIDVVIKGFVGSTSMSILHLAGKRMSHSVNLAMVRVTEDTGCILVVLAGYYSTMQHVSNKNEGLNPQQAM
jgi:hypothetical protein